MLSTLGSSATVNASVTTDLQSAVQPLLTTKAVTPGVTLDLTTGAVSVDLDKLLGGLNSLPANTRGAQRLRGQPDSELDHEAARQPRRPDHGAREHGPAEREGRPGRQREGAEHRGRQPGGSRQAPACRRSRVCPQCSATCSDLLKLCTPQAATPGTPAIPAVPASPRSSASIDSAFDAAELSTVRVDAKSLVTVRQNKYSVPVSLAGLRVCGREFSACGDPDLSHA